MLLSAYGEPTRSPPMRCKGMRTEHLGAHGNLSAFYLIGLPIAIILGFKLHMGEKGLWIGILAGAIMQTILLFLITSSTNWQNQADKKSELPLLFYSRRYMRARPRCHRAYLCTPAPHEGEEPVSRSPLPCW